tara:strand:+ start:161 stop:394 length:234 start_codon:yes stop_codon:yes gene_type:complete
MLKYNIYEELVRIREVLALDSYARQMAQVQKRMSKAKWDNLPADKLQDRIDRELFVAEELDKIRNDMRKICYPEEHI